MAEFSSMSSPTERYKNPTSFPRLLTSFTPLKTSLETFDTAMMSPTSILDTKTFSSLKNPLTTPRTPGPESAKRQWDKLEPKSIGLGLVDVLIDEKPDSSLSRPECGRMVLCGSQLKIQVPTQGTESLSPLSPGDFGIKTRNSQMGSLITGLSPPLKRAFFGQGNPGMDAPNSPPVFTGCLSASDMELSEEYTCVISHIGPTPKTTHIFYDCVVDSFSFSSPSYHGRGTNGLLENEPPSYPSDSFLSFCYTCKKNLRQGKDIYMYRGEKAFCSSECRHHEMRLEEGLDKLDHRGNNF